MLFGTVVYNIWTKRVGDLDYESINFCSKVRYTIVTAVVHYPKTKEGWDELGKRVATAHANYVIEKIDRLNCPTWQKLELLQAVIDTTKGTYKPKEHQKPGWQPSR